MSTPASSPRHGAARFLIGVGVSMYGDWLSTVALLVILYGLSQNAAAPAGYMLARTAPRVFGPLLGGHLIDRWSSTSTLAAATVTQGVLTASMLAAIQVGAVWWVYVAVVASQFGGSVARPTHNAIIPAVALGPRLQRVNAVYNVLIDTALFIAPALAAIVLATVGPKLLLGLDAVSFVICAGLIGTLRLPTVAHPSSLRTTGAFETVRRDRPLRIITVGFFAGPLVVTCLQAVLVVAAAERFGGSDSVTVFYSAVGLGGLLASGLVLLRPSVSLPAGGIALGALLEVASVAVFGLPRSIAVAAAIIAFGGFWGALYQTLGGADLQTRVPRHLLGRVSGAVNLSLSAGCLLGAVDALTLAPLWGWQPTLAVTGAAGAVMIAVAAVLPGSDVLTRADAAAEEPA